MQNAVMVLQMLHSLVALQISVCLTGTDAETAGKLADECHRISDEISFFACHNPIPFVEILCKDTKFWLSAYRMVNLFC